MLKHFLILAVIAQVSCFGKNKDTEEAVKAEDDSGEVKDFEGEDSGDDADTEVAAPVEEEIQQQEAPSQPVEQVQPVAPMVATTPNSGTAVFYVTAKSAPIFQQANASSGQNGSLKKGQRVLGASDGQWLSLSSGGFVELKNLSQKPVGIERGSGKWQQK